MNIFKQLQKNSVAIIGIKVASSAKLPLKTCRGTIAQRTMQAAKYSKTFVSELNKTSKKSCTINEFNSALNNTLGENKIKFCVQPLYKKFSHGSLERDVSIKNNIYNIGNIHIEDTSSKIEGYIFHFPLQKEGTIIPEKHTAVHEARHMFDYLCHPKTIQIRSFNLLYNKENYNTYNSIYSDFVNNYNPSLSMKKFRKNITKKINELPNTEAINVLQNSREAMQSELNAYNDELNYLMKSPIKNFFAIFSIYNFLKVMNYNKKIKFANKLLKTKLNEEISAHKTLFSK